ncbi:MAG: ketopantoate reductase family protein, partial [Tumebacillaceae bacterium]
WMSENQAQTAKWWADLLTACGHPVQVANDIRTEIWRKAMVNIGINPFTALWEITNGDLLQKAELLPWMKRAVEEAEAVARAEGVLLTNSVARVEEVCRLTANNRSSMLQDRLRGRETEIDALCGVVVSLGEKWGIATQVNRLLLELLSSGAGTSTISHAQLLERLQEIDQS